MTRRLTPQEIITREAAKNLERARKMAANKRIRELAREERERRELADIQRKRKQGKKP